MKGLELSEKFYIEYGEPMLRENFPDLLDKIAVGLVGGGSECFGFDDELSSDHDFCAGFCIFLPDEDTVDRKTAFTLERAYSRLPKEFMGYVRPPLSPVGGNRHGVIRMSDFFASKTGEPDGELTDEEWLTVPEASLAEAVNGRVFFDGLGRFTEIRGRISSMPRDIMLKKLAGELLMMGQSGQYNYGRCIKRGDTAAAQLAAIEFAKSAIHTVFLLNGRYMPYYKWSFRALSELPRLNDMYGPLEYLISSGNGAAEAVEKQAVIEMICGEIAKTLRNEGFSSYGKDELEGHSYAVNERIKDAEIRNMHILAAVS